VLLVMLLLLQTDIVLLVRLVQNGYQVAALPK
jgi:hypothetical protein